MDTSAPVFAESSVAQRVASIKTFNIASEDAENVASRRGSSTLRIVVASKDPILSECFEKIESVEVRDERL